MAAGPHPRIVLGLDLVLLAFWVGGALSGAGPLLAAGVGVLLALLWFKGFLRFRRLRRFAMTIGVGIWDFVRTRRMSRRALRNLGVLAGAIVVLVLLNQLRLRAPGKGRGLSIPTNPSLDFTGLNSPGAVFTAVLWSGLVAVLLAMVWYRWWQGVERGPPLRSRLYWGCLAAFLLAPAIFGVLDLILNPDTTDPEKAKRNAELSTNLFRGTLVVMAISFTGAAALPYVGPDPVAKPRAPSPPAVEIQIQLERPHVPPYLGERRRTPRKPNGTGAGRRRLG